MTKRVLFFLMLWTSLVIVADAMDRALVVGVNYYKQPGIRRTEGSVEDAEAIKDVLQTRFSFAPSSITVLRNEKATAQNILLELDRLVKETKHCDRVFLHYSRRRYYQFLFRQARRKTDWYVCRLVQFRHSFTRNYQ